MHTLPTAASAKFATEAIDEAHWKCVEIMLKKILIANRSEIAVRVIAACRELGIKTVAIYSEPDRMARHVALADESIQLEGQPARVYLDGAQIVEIAKRTGCDGVHPGYGFLSENADFARACLAQEIKFIGPAPDVIQRMGSKVESRRAMHTAGVPVVPGTTDPVSDVATVKELATKYGYPIAIKASAGGGGRGLRVVRSEQEVEAALAGAQREGASYFGSGEVYVEKYLDLPRHIEVQVLGDEHGNIIHLGERDCSSQRRHQKLLEETPAPSLNPQLRERLLAAAVKGAQSLGYTSAGTLEFLVSGNEFYFLEVNTRVQVEHPITEMVTGIDIVKEQMRIASGEWLTISQSDVKARGHAIECRINAEDPERNFMPSPGTIKDYVEPRMPWVRVDGACYAGYQVLPFYDSLLAKLVVWGRDREEAIARTKLALKDFRIDGVRTTIPFHLFILEDNEFLQGRMNTAYVESSLAKAFMEKAKGEAAAAPVAGKAATAAAPGASAVASVKQSASSVDSPDAVPSEPSLKSASPVGGPEAGAAKPPSTNGRSGHNVLRAGPYKFEVQVNDRAFKVAVTELIDPDQVAQPLHGLIPNASSPGGRRIGERPSAKRKETAAPAGKTANASVTAPMHGVVKEILVESGAEVDEGEKVVIFEAMKMESELVAPRRGKVARIIAKRGDTIESGETILEID
ncbi:MAG TPA: acetyl-CoA carboxylase biotin carboxylase subunit [Candidatus Obscuribacterales bacterium]